MDSGETLLMSALVVGGVVGVAALLRMLALDPIPTGRRSLHREARRMLRPKDRRQRWELTLDALEPWRPLARLGCYAVLVAMLWLPIPLRWGPLDSTVESDSYLKTLWQVVAAALGVSVAMVAFAFEAFSTSAQRSYGGSLREFARQSQLAVAIELGLLTLLVIGVTLFGGGHDSPAGWSGGWSIGLSAVSLCMVGLVVHRILWLLDERSLNQMRTLRVKRLVRQALRQQLIGQAADAWLVRSRLPVGQHAFNTTGLTPLLAHRRAAVRDVWVGPLARYSARFRDGGAQAHGVQLAVSVGGDVSEGSPMLYFAGKPNAWTLRRLRRAIRLRRRNAVRADRALVELLDSLHQQAMQAVREGRENDWRDISEAYEMVMLGLPRAALDWGLPFSGAVMAPGFFGHGPVQRIRDFLYEELVAAVDSNSRELIDPITYLPQHLAVEATRLGAPALAAPLLQLHVSMYYLAVRGQE